MCELVNIEKDSFFTTGVDNCRDFICCKFILAFKSSLRNSSLTNGRALGYFWRKFSISFVFMFSKWGIFVFIFGNGFISSEEMVRLPVACESACESACETEFSCVVCIGSGWKLLWYL